MKSISFQSWLMSVFVGVFVGLLLELGGAGEAVWAAGGGTPPAAPQQGIVGMLVPFAAMFAVIYFLMIRPQQNKMKQQQAMLSQLKEGDEVLTASGILGKITGITEKVVTVEVDRNVRLKMLKSQITQVINGNLGNLKDAAS